MRTCPEGHQNADASRFCEQCGLQLPATAATFGTVASSLPPEMYPVNAAQVPARRKRQGWVIPVIMLCVLLLGGGGFLLFRAVSPSTTTVSIKVTVFGETDCSSFGMGIGYMDIPGSLLTVRADGENVGVTTLAEYGEFDVLGCTFTAAVPGVPTDASIYTLETGRRGEISNTRSEMEANGWTFDASLGN